MNVVAESVEALQKIDRAQVEATIEAIREAERVFCVGNGGGYAHAAHFAADLRKIANKQSFSPDSMGEMTARINDEGWWQAWSGWRDSFGVREGDMQFIFSVGGALTEKVSANLYEIGAPYGIVGAKGAYGYDRIIIPSTSTPVIEGCQSVIAHHIVEQLR